MKCLIYARVSSERQIREGHGLDSQEQRCRAYATNKNYQVESVFLDSAVSGALFQRPAMQRLIAYLDDHPEETYAIVFDDLSRFARDVKTHIQLKAELVSRGSRLECLNFSFDDSEESEFAELILAASNQYQRKSNRRQVVQKMRARLQRGLWPFGLPLGLKNEKNEQFGKIATPQEPFASILKGALERFRDGLLRTPLEVKNYLHKEFEVNGLPNRPALSSVQEMLRDPLYAGHISYEPWGVAFQKGHHKGIITLETFQHIQQRLEDRSKPWQRKDTKLDFPLRPWVLCDSCDRPMTGSWNKGRNKRYANYFCRWQGCKYVWKTTSKDKLESEFEDLLSASQPLLDSLGLAQDILQQEWDFRFEKHVEYRARKKSELEEITTQIESFLRRIPKTNDEKLIEMYEQEILKLKKEKLKIENSLGLEKYTSQQFGTATIKVLNVLKEPLSMWQSTSYEDKRTVLFMFFEDRLRYSYKNGFGTANLAHEIKLIAEVGAAKKPIVEMSGSEPESE